MKIKLLISLLLLQSINLFAQTPVDYRKYIEVTGSAEKSIPPDEIELEIILTEYSIDGSTVKFERIEKDFYSTLIKNNIDTQKLKLNSLESNYWWFWWSKRNKPLKSKSFRLTISNNINFLKLTEDLNKKWVESINIIDKKNKNIQDFRREVKIAAIKAAKEKATYLLESINEHLGSVISVEEINEESSQSFSRNMFLSNTTTLEPNNYDEVENVSAIKIRYEIKVKFEIK